MWLAEGSQLLVVGHGLIEHATRRVVARDARQDKKLAAYGFGRHVLVGQQAGIELLDCEEVEA